MDESHRAAERIGREANVGVGEEKPFAGGGFVGFLQSVWFAEPALRQFFHVEDAKAIVGLCGIVENGGRFVLRAVVDGDDFEIWIGNFRQRFEREREFLLLVAGGEDRARRAARFVWREAEIC